MKAEVYEICAECGCEFSAEGTIRQGSTNNLCYACEVEEQEVSTSCAKCGCEIVESPTWQHDGLCYNCA